MATSSKKSKTNMAAELTAEQESFIKISDNCYTAKDNRSFESALRDYFMNDERFQSFEDVSKLLASRPLCYPSPITFKIEDETFLTGKIYIKIVKEKNSNDRKQFEYHHECYSTTKTCKNKKDDASERRGSKVIQDWWLQELGEYGWEMCGATHDGTWSKYFFKREK